MGSRPSGSGNRCRRRARSIGVYVNGIDSRSVDFCPPNHGTALHPLKPCPASSTQQLAIDTEKDPGWTNGPNDVAICSTDVGGNVSSPCVRRTVQVDNSCPGSGGTAARRSRCWGRYRRTAEAIEPPSPRRVHPVIRGSLKDGAGNPVAGATVCIYETIDLPDASRELVSTATTQSNGRFATRLDAGPSRRLDLVYRYNNRVLGDDGCSSIPGSFRRSRSRRSASRMATQPCSRGGSLGRTPRAGRLRMQARVGRKWRTFKQLRTDSDGRFRGQVPLHADDRTRPLRLPGSREAPERLSVRARRLTQAEARRSRLSLSDRLGISATGRPLHISMLVWPTCLAFALGRVA